MNSIGRKKLAISLVDKFIGKTSDEKSNFLKKSKKELDSLEEDFLAEKNKLEKKYKTSKNYLKSDEGSKLKDFQDDFHKFQDLRKSLAKSDKHELKWKTYIKKLKVEQENMLCH